MIYTGPRQLVYSVGPETSHSLKQVVVVGSWIFRRTLRSPSLTDFALFIVVWRLATSTTILPHRRVVNIGAKDREPAARFFQASRAQWDCDVNTSFKVIRRS